MSQRHKTLTPALIWALVALGALAVVTLIVVIRSPGSDDPNQKADASSSSGSQPGKFTSTDGAFAYNRPAGYEDAAGKTEVPNSVAQMYLPSSDSAFPTTILVNTEPANGGSLADAASNSRKVIESNLSTKTSDLALDISTIDGEPAVGYSVDDYQKSGVTARSSVILTLHKDTLYGVIVNSRATNSSAGLEQALELVKSMKWT